MIDFQKSTADSINKNASLIKAVSDAIHANPELGFEEFNAAGAQLDLLRNAGFSIKSPAGSLPTSFKAECGKGSPAFCLLSEYDALPELGHACGHNLIAASAIAAGLAVKEVMELEAIPGRLVIMGTPGEETKGGKVIMLAENAFEGIGACAMTHPFHLTGPDPGNLAVSRYDVTFNGKAAHAASEPEAGINALDAINLLFCGINAWRQQLHETSRIHGIITEGGIAPNIIPERAGAFFYIRAVDNTIRDAMEARFKDIVKGAALMTGCDYQCAKVHHSYDANIPNGPLNGLVMELAAQFKMDPQTVSSKISTDFANVTQEIPGVSFFFKATHDPVSLHSREFEKAAGNVFAFDQAMLAARVLAVTALMYLTDGKLREAVKADFERRKAGKQN
ncbi:MAG: amidohydrolase [Victivallaceae bacterium]|jgi:amidohydrolase